MNRPLWVYGAGGHGRVVAEAAEAAGFEVRGFIDDATEPGARIDVWQVVGHFETFKTNEPVVVAVGDNAVRHRLIERVLGCGLRLETVVHPSAVLSRSARIGEGVFVSAGAVINAAAEIGRGAICNSRAVVEHEASVGETAHLGPGSILCGQVSVGTGAMVGAGAVVLPGRRVEEGARVGAGSVVVQDVGRGRTVVGIPARVQGD